MESRADLATATFAGGCFWCMEPPFDNAEGVVSTTSGYCGGTEVHPTYQDVSAGTTGHAEALQVCYKYYRYHSGRDQYLDAVWGADRKKKS